MATAQVSDKMLDLTGTVRKLGIDKVAEKSGVKPAQVKKFCDNPLQSKNSDIAKIQSAVKAMLAENPLPSDE
jgi:hypothetical protein